MENLENIVKEIQDYLVPKLDGTQQMIYHFLFRHSRLEDRREILVGSRSIVERIGKARTGVRYWLVKQFL